MSNSSIRELYPEGNLTPQRTYDYLTRHARKLETVIIQDQATHERIVELEEEQVELRKLIASELGKISRELSEANAENHKLKIAQAERDAEYKKWGLILGVLGPLIGTLLMFAIQLMMRPSTVPQVILTPEQKVLLQQMEAAPKR